MSNGVWIWPSLYCCRLDSHDVLDNHRSKSRKCKTWLFRQTLSFSQLLQHHTRWVFSAHSYVYYIILCYTVHVCALYEVSWDPVSIQFCDTQVQHSTPISWAGSVMDSSPHLLYNRPVSSRFLQQIILLGDRNIRVRTTSQPSGVEMPPIASLKALNLQLSQRATLYTWLFDTRH